MRGRVWSEGWKVESGSEGEVGGSEVEGGRWE